MLRQIVKATWRPIAVAVAVCALAWLSTSILWAWRASADELPRVALVDPTAITSPRTMRAADAWIDDGVEVLGVLAGGRHRAYLVRALRPFQESVVNDQLGGVAVTISFCDRTNLARAFTDSAGTGPLDLATSGYLGRFDVGTMLVQAKGGQYRQDNLEPLDGGTRPFPFAPFPLERMTWKKWRDAHPDTDIFVGAHLVRPPSRKSPEPIRQITVLPAAKARLRDTAEVIGVAVQGGTRAYLVRAFGPIERRIVNDVIAGVPVTVSHCQETDRSQVFQGKSGAEALDVTFGGYQGDADHGGMLLRVGKWRYRQDTGLGQEADAPVFPYARGKYERTTWKRWRDANPGTDVYAGGS